MSGFDYYGKEIYDFNLLPHCEHVESAEVIVCKTCLEHILSGLYGLVKKIRAETTSRYMSPMAAILLRDIANQIENLYKEGR